MISPSLDEVVRSFSVELGKKLRAEKVDNAKLSA